MLDETFPFLPLPPMQNIEGGCAAPTGWGLHWLTEFPALDNQWNQSTGSAYNSEDWRGRVKLIPANSGLPGITPICFYRMKITLVPFNVRVTWFHKRRRGRTVFGGIKRSFLLFWGSFLLSPSFSVFTRTLSTSWRGTYISQHLGTYIGKWVSLRDRLHASLTGSLRTRIQAARLRKEKIEHFIFSKFRPFKAKESMAI